MGLIYSLWIGLLLLNFYSHFLPLTSVLSIKIPFAGMIATRTETKHVLKFIFEGHLSRQWNWSRLCFDILPIKELNACFFSHDMSGCCGQSSHFINFWKHIQKRYLSEFVWKSLCWDLPISVSSHCVKIKWKSLRFS